MSWRPKEWENPYNFQMGGSIPGYERQSKSYEDGAEAMLEALKKEGRYGVLYDGSHSPLNQIPIKGWSIFIPEEDK